MDIAKLSMVNSQTNLRLEASLAMTKHVQQFSEQVGEDFIEMLEKSTPPAPHPTLGHSIDIKA